MGWQYGLFSSELWDSAAWELQTTRDLFVALFWQINKGLTKHNSRGDLQVKTKRCWSDMNFVAWFWFQGWIRVNSAILRFWICHSPFPTTPRGPFKPVRRAQSEPTRGSEQNWESITKTFRVDLIDISCIDLLPSPSATHQGQTKRSLGSSLARSHRTDSL
jgi:hypothetical protein